MSVPLVSPPAGVLGQCVCPAGDSGEFELRDASAAPEDGGDVCGPSFPVFNAACDAGRDCAFGIESLLGTCVGATQAVGFAADEETAFLQAVAMCGGSCFSLPGSPVETQAGTFGSSNQVAVACTGGQCTTYIDAGPNGQVDCDAGIFPTLDSSCATGSDCGVGYHHINCCGTTLAIGVSTAQSATFASDEGTCRSQYPPCDCDGGPVETQSGMTTNGDSVQVNCVSGQCVTSVFDGG